MKFGKRSKAIYIWNFVHVTRLPLFNLFQNKTIVQGRFITDICEIVFRRGKRRIFTKSKNKKKLYLIERGKKYLLANLA